MPGNRSGLPSLSGMPFEISISLHHGDQPPVQLQAGSGRSARTHACACGLSAPCSAPSLNGHALWPRASNTSASSVCTCRVALLTVCCSQSRCSSSQLRHAALLPGPPAPAPVPVPVLLLVAEEVLVMVRARPMPPHRSSSSASGIALGLAAHIMALAQPRAPPRPAATASRAAPPSWAGSPGLRSRPVANVRWRRRQFGAAGLQHLGGRYQPHFGAANEQHMDPLASIRCWRAPSLGPHQRRVAAGRHGPSSGD